MIHEYPHSPQALNEMMRTLLVSAALWLSVLCIANAETPEQRIEKLEAAGVHFEFEGEGIERTVASIRIIGDVASANTIALACEFTDARELTIGGLHLTDDALAPLAKMTKLESLRIRSPKLNGSGLKAISNLTTLRNLNLSCNGNLTDDSMAHLSRLKVKTLGLTGVRITDAATTHLVKIKTLQELRIMHTKITFESLKGLRTLPNLKRAFLPRSIPVEVRRQFEKELQDAALL